MIKHHLCKLEDLHWQMVCKAKSRVSLGYAKGKQFTAQPSQYKEIRKLWPHWGMLK